MNLEGKTEEGKKPKEEAKLISRPIYPGDIKSNYRPVELCKRLERDRLWRELSSRSKVVLDRRYCFGCNYGFGGFP